MLKTAMVETERRAEQIESARILKRELNEAQLDALIELERFGWYLKFVRRNPPRPPRGVLCDPDAHKFAILDENGDLHENPSEKFRISA